MTDSQSRPDREPSEAERDLAPHERPEVGLIADEDLPEDLQPTDDNPLAKNPGEEGEDAGDTDEAARKVEGMPDMAPE